MQLLSITKSVISFEITLFNVLFDNNTFLIKSNSNQD